MWLALPILFQVTFYPLMAVATLPGELRILTRIYKRRRINVHEGVFLLLKVSSWVGKWRSFGSTFTDADSRARTRGRAAPLPGCHHWSIFRVVCGPRMGYCRTLLRNVLVCQMGFIQLRHIAHAHNGLVSPLSLCVCT